MAALKRVIDETPTPVREIKSDVPDWLCAIVEKLQAKKAEDRFGSAKEVAELLGKHLADVQAHGRTGTTARVDSPETAVKPRPLSLTTVLGLIGGTLAAVVLIAILGVLYWPRGGEVVPPEKKDPITKE